MKKVFNTTGNCFREEHYMMDNSAKVAKVMELVEAGRYFTIARLHPRKSSDEVGTLAWKNDAAVPLRY